MSERTESDHEENRLNSRAALQISRNTALVLLGLIGVSGPLLGTPKCSIAAGFAITAQGAAATGKSTAFTAQADDPSAIYYNPAGLSQLSTPQVLLGSSIIVPKTSYHPDPGGRSEQEENQTFFLPHLYAAYPLDRNFAVGLGVFAPFGLATDWPLDWDGRYQVTFASVQAAVVNPTISWKPAGWLSLATGLNLAYVTVKQRRQINLSRVGEDIGIGPLPGNPEGSVSLDGSTTAVGFNAGVLIGPSELWRVGLNFRSRIHAEINDGHADFDIPVPAFQPAFPDGRVQTEVDLPPVLGAGILLRPRPNWNLEFDAVWTGWKTIDQLVVSFEQGLPVPSETTDFLWDNSMAYSIGTEYHWAPYVFRAGYTYDFTPVPDETVSPIIPDGNRQFFSVGAGVLGELWDLDFAYQLLLFERVKNNIAGDGFSSVGGPGIPAIDARANGRYESYSHTLVLSLRRHF